MAESTFDQITKKLEYSNYFDIEAWYRDVLQTNYEIISKDGFTILIEYRNKFGYKIGHSRGGVKFDVKEKTYEQYLTFISFLKTELKAKGYMLLGVEPMAKESEYLNVFEKTHFREHTEGTAFIYPKENWINKFNSKKRYDMLMGAKKGVMVDILTSFEDIKKYGEPDVFFDSLHDSITYTLRRHQTKYPVPNKEIFKRIFSTADFVLPVAVLDGKIIAFNVSLFNASKTRVERVFASANDLGLKYRASPLIESKMVEYLTQIGIKTYDMWGINTKQSPGVTEFKKSLADEIVYYAPYYCVLKIKPLLASLTMFLITSSMRLQHIKNKFLNRKYS